VFLDRDGTLNVEKNYLYRIEDFQWVPGAPEAVKKLNDAGFWVIVVTNQAGIARGFYKEADMRRLHDHMAEDLAKIGARIDGFYFCPHHPDDPKGCDCRKPKPGMIRQAEKDFDIDRAASFLVGDRVQDVEAAKAAGVSPILVKTGYGAEESLRLAQGAAPVVEDIAEACAYIKNHTPNIGRGQK
jgi:D-glycero-D-manno-heptose 1,7-bisphosphate phosphatase